MKAICTPSSGRRRTREEIRSILEWQQQSGLSLLAFARKQGLCYASLLRWRAQYPSAAPVPQTQPGHPGHAPDAEPSSPRFVPVQLEAVRSSESFVLEWGAGRSLRIPAGFDPHQLRHLLEALGVGP